MHWVTVSTQHIFFTESEAVWDPTAAAFIGPQSRLLLTGTRSHQSRIYQLPQKISLQLHIHDVWLHLRITTTFRNMQLFCLYYIMPFQNMESYFSSTFGFWYSDLKIFIFKVDIYAYVSCFSKIHGIEIKLYRLVPHGLTSLAMYLILELDAWFGQNTRKCLVDTYAYVSLTHIRMCHVPNLVNLHVCLAIEVQAQCMY